MINVDDLKAGDRIEYVSRRSIPSCLSAGTVYEVHESVNGHRPWNLHIKCGYGRHWLVAMAALDGALPMFDKAHTTE